MRDQHNDTFCLNSDYSTTRLVTRKKPVIVNKPEDKFETVLFLPEGENRTGQGGLRTQGLFKHSLPDKPLITVITVVLNGAKHLEETILSVLNQTYDNVEYIIIDGGSTDETLDIIRKYEHAIDYWVSEKDEGIYDAMNKGIKCATGEVVGIINADDYYHANSLESISKAFESSEKIIYFGRLLYIDTDLCLQRVLSIDVPKKDSNLIAFHIHPAIFINTICYKNIIFNSEYKIVSDKILMIDMFRYRFSFKKIDTVLSTMRSGGASSKAFNELFYFVYKYFGIFKSFITIITLYSRHILSHTITYFPIFVRKKIKTMLGYVKSDNMHNVIK